MNDSKDILAVGSIAFDTIETPKGKREHILGGSSTYFSVSSALYSDVSLIGVVGKDFTEEHWEVFEKYNINVDSVDKSDGLTFSWGGKYNHDFSSRDTLFTNLGVFENFKPNVINNYNNPILYLGNIQPELQFDVISKVKDPFLIAADSMNLWIDLFPKDVIKLIHKVDIFLLNDEEAMQLCGHSNLNKIIKEFLSYGPKIVIIKMGSKGSLIGFDNQIIKVSCVPNVQVVDPTGAGDSFAGGVLGYIAQNGLDDPVKAVMHGTAVASFTVSAFGLENLYNIQLDLINDKIKEIQIL
ncbi:MAG: sugar kinase [Candidatus Marinimicrobia bacterium]|nr:sugar kinase [Candidatus Neomarinimicrobiota bacterium]|tara:strand:+ start:4723 stop:5613 length:891 start_codon:yes stop_codon:yes gene_type:complete